ncbi:MAG: hypothetical protein QF464_15815 [Myxococcota bacterium]|nr:hypothetical protein [Myxococcota bacterium]
MTPVDVVKAYGAAEPSARKAWLLDGHQPVAPDEAGFDGAVEVERRATWQVSGRPDVSVAQVDGRWVLTGGILASRIAETPAQALALFSRAVMTRDASLLRALMPLSDRTYWSEERAGEFLRDARYRPVLESLVQRIASLPVTNSGPAGPDEVTVGDDAGQVVLVREEDGWKVLDLRPHAHFSPEETRPPVSSPPE